MSSLEVMKMQKPGSEEWYYQKMGEVPDIQLLCGNTASFDYASGISYRCTTCLAVVGSIGMPRECKDLYDMEIAVAKLKGQNAKT